LELNIYLYASSCMRVPYDASTLRSQYITTSEICSQINNTLFENGVKIS